jgi:polysaccharide export outer membrane protein
MLLGGCASLPSSGPTGAQIRQGASDPKAGVDFHIVELDNFDTLPPMPARPAVFQPDYAPPPTDLIGSGDQLDISIYEAGVTLFAGGGGKITGASAGSFETSAQVERLPVARVDDNGDIRLPYIGMMRAAGSTTAELAAAIRRAYRGMSQNPQVLVALHDSIRNSVIIGGEVGRPGRLVLPTNKETVSDAIALAGGYRGDAKDISVRIQRLDSEAEFRLSDVLAGEFADMRVYPGDKISLVRAPRTFSVMGAPGRVEQIPFSGPSVNLAEAVATAGGANPNLGDPKAIFIFRFVPVEGGGEQPVVYHLNMMKPGGYFISQRFQMLDKDVLYVGNAAANQPSKLVQIISQLFAPVVTVSNIARAGN